MSRYVEGGGAPSGTIKREHVVIAEHVLGKPLPFGVEVHHVDGNGKNNTNTNLVICQDRFYHRLLHRRLRALLACGNPNWRKCSLCKKYDDLDNLKDQDGLGRSGFVHVECSRSYATNRRKITKSKRNQWLKEQQ